MMEEATDQAATGKTQEEEEGGDRMQSKQSPIADGTSEEGNDEKTTTIHQLPTTTGGVIYTIGIAGGSGAGKTTLAKKIFESLGGEQNVCYLVHDAYYKDQSSKTYEERCRTNFDHPCALESDLMLQHVHELKAGRSVSIPVYDFATHTRTANAYRVVTPKPILLLEGILLLHDEALVKEMDLKVFVDAEADIRFIRRLTRDCAERGRTMEQVIAQYHDTVRPMHNLFVEPSKRVANLIVHASHHGIETFDISCSVLSNHLRAVAEQYRWQSIATGMVIGNHRHDHCSSTTATSQRTAARHTNDEDTTDAVK